jgi:glycosyltransferase involved in cell wall biosynthesis
MKIAVWHNLPSGGGKRALFGHVRGLVERGHTVEAWCTSTADIGFLALGDLISETVVPLQWHDIGTLPDSFAEKVKWAMLGGHRNLASMHEHCRRCAEEINARGFDVLFANSSAYLAVAPIARYANIPTVLYLQEPQRRLYEAMPTWPWVRPELSANPLKRLVHQGTTSVKLKHYEALARDEWRNIRAYDRVLVNSFFSRESVLRAYGVESRVCYLGIDTTLFADRGRSRSDFLVGVGSYTPSKNIEFAINSLAKVRGQRPRLVWVGNQTYGHYLDYLIGLATRNEVDFDPQQVVSDQRLVEIYNDARMMIYAPRLEPFGFAPLEANACGLPVVATPEGGVRETIVDGENGVLVEPDEVAMARAVEHLRDDPERCRQLGRNARRLVEQKWSMAASIDRLERHLEETVSARRSERPAHG